MAFIIKDVNVKSLFRSVVFLLASDWTTSTNRRTLSSHRLTHADVLCHRCMLQKYSGGEGSVQLVFTAEPWQQFKIALPAGIYGSMHTNTHTNTLFQTLNFCQLKVVKLFKITHVHRVN